jgi:hypothetical protein
MPSMQQLPTYMYLKGQFIFQGDARDGDDNVLYRYRMMQSRDSLCANGCCASPFCTCCACPGQANIAVWMHYTSGRTFVVAVGDKYCHTYRKRDKPLVH